MADIGIYRGRDGRVYASVSTWPTAAYQWRAASVTDLIATLRAEGLAPRPVFYADPDRRDIEAWSGVVVAESRDALLAKFPPQPWPKNALYTYGTDAATT